MSTQLPLISSDVEDRRHPQQVRMGLPFRMEIMILSCLLIHLLSISVSAELRYECPEPEEIYPCYCEEDDGDPSVFCNHMTTPDEIYKGVKGLKGHRIYQMSFFRNWILQPIKPDAFKDLSVERISFENSTIKLTAPQFQGLGSHLNSIQLRACFNITNPLIPLELDHLSKLRELMFEKNKITKLPNDWLKSPPDSLRSITIEGNTIITLEDEVFAKVKRLTFLVLESNRILIIKRSMFPSPANDLRTINLNNNKIRFLPDDIFSDMPSLRSIEMQGNRLTTLDKNVWSDTFLQLTKLDVTGNPFECDHNLKWITKSRKPNIFTGKCQGPEGLRNKMLFLLESKDFS